jgi:hypothetical protein
MKQAELVRLARIGAEARIAQLQAEIDAIQRQFPGAKAGRGSRANHGAGGAPRKPRQMSAAARRRSSQAAKKRWEQWRKEHGK